MGFFKTRTVNCGDWKIRVFRNSQDAFPLHAKEWSASYKAATNAAQQISAEVGGEFSEHVGALFVDLDTANRSMQLKLASIYTYYSESPCKRETWFERRLERTLDEESLTRRALIELKGLQTLAATKAPQKELVASLDKMMQRLRLTGDEAERHEAFGEAAAALELWRRGGSAHG